MHKRETYEDKNKCGFLRSGIMFRQLVERITIVRQEEEHSGANGLGFDGVPYLPLRSDRPKE